MGQTRNRASSQQISLPPQMFSKTTEFNSHVTRLCSLIQRSIHQSLLLTRNWEDIARDDTSLTTRCGICQKVGHSRRTCDYYESWSEWDNNDHDVFQRAFRRSLTHLWPLERPLDDFSTWLTSATLLPNGPKTTISHINYFCKNRKFKLKPN